MQLILFIKAKKNTPSPTQCMAEREGFPPRGGTCSSPAGQAGPTRHVLCPTPRQRSPAPPWKQAQVPPRSSPPPTPPCLNFIPKRWLLCLPASSPRHQEQPLTLYLERKANHCFRVRPTPSSHAGVEGHKIVESQAQETQCSR